MVQQTIDSKFSEYGLGNTETNLSARDKQFPVAMKKTALRDVQNENRISNSIGNSPLTKNIGQTMDAFKLSGIKRSSPEDPLSPSHFHSPSTDQKTNAANSHLVYSRRKSEAEIGKNSSCNCRNINADFPNSTQHDHPEETTEPQPQIQEAKDQPKPQIKEPKVSCFPALASMPVASSISASAKPSVPLPLGQTTTRIAAAESNYHPIASAIPLLNNAKGLKNLHWEERYRQLQILLKKLEESRQEDYIQMLWSLSSVELSRHAIELEKRAIQLSLEEAKEMQRVGILNVLGKSMKSFKANLTHQGL